MQKKLLILKDNLSFFSIYLSITKLYLLSIRRKVPKIDLLRVIIHYLKFFIKIISKKYLRNNK